MEANNGREMESPMEKEEVPGENITVKVVTVVTFLTIFGGGVWWARGLQSDVRSVQLDVASIRLSVAQLDKISSIQADVGELRRYGSDVSRKLERDVIELRRDFELHKATTATSTKP
jgi:hypothetical protein